MTPSIAPDVQAALLAQTAIDLIDNSQDPKSGALMARHMLLRISELLPAVPNISRTALTTPPTNPVQERAPATPMSLGNVRP